MTTIMIYEIIFYIAAFHTMVWWVLTIFLFIGRILTVDDPYVHKKTTNRLTIMCYICFALLIISQACTVVAAVKLSKWRTDTPVATCTQCIEMEAE